VRHFKWFANYNWKVILIRIIINGLTISLVALLSPKINVLNRSLVTFLILGAGLGLVNAFIKPIIQFFTLPLLWGSYGLVVVVINGFMLWLLSVLLPRRLEVNSVLAALVGGALAGLFAIVLETIMGVTPPILDDELVAESRGQQEARV